jgi:hypothetical protein
MPASLDGGQGILKQMHSASSCYFRCQKGLAVEVHRRTSLAYDGGVPATACDGCTSITIAIILSTSTSTSTGSVQYKHKWNLVGGRGAWSAVTRRSNWLLVLAGRLLKTFCDFRPSQMRKRANASYSWLRSPCCLGRGVHRVFLLGSATCESEAFCLSAS